MPETNPNGANQYQLDPRQKLCWDYYIDPTSETFSNATQSAMKAGYTEAYADQITVNDWFIGRLWVLNSVNESEKVFRDIITANHIDIETGKIDAGVLRIKADIAKFLASTQGKDQGYSTKSDDAMKRIAEKVSMTPEQIAIANKYEKELEENL